MQREKRCCHLAPSSSSSSFFHNFSEYDLRRSTSVESSTFPMYGETFHFPEGNSSANRPYYHSECFNKRWTAASPLHHNHYNHHHQQHHQHHPSSTMYGQSSSSGEFCEHAQGAYSDTEHYIPQTLPSYAEPSALSWDATSSPSCPIPLTMNEWPPMSDCDCDACRAAFKRYLDPPSFEARPHIQTPFNPYSTAGTSTQPSSYGEPSHCCPYCSPAFPISSSPPSSLSPSSPSTYWESSTNNTSPSPDITICTPPIPLHQPRPERPIPIIPLSELASACEQPCIPTAYAKPVATTALLKPRSLPEMPQLTYPPSCSDLRNYINNNASPWIRTS